MIKGEIKKIVQTAVKKIGSINMPEALIEVPKDKTHGDYATNISFELAKVLKRNPGEIASLLKSKIEKKGIFKKVETVGGFLNFFIRDEFFNENLKQILKEKNKFGKNQNLKNQKVIIEYTDPNPFKVFHIGHLMSNTIGETVARLHEAIGAKVIRVNYQGDVGLHVAKAVYGLYLTDQISPIQHLDIYMLGQAYVRGVEVFEKNESDKKEILKLNKLIYGEQPDKTGSQWPTKWYKEGKNVSLKYFEEIYKKLGTKFDGYFFESQIADFGKRIVEDGLKKGIFKKGENGAIIFKGEKFGLHTRVFINAEGLPTYEAKELALAKTKYDKYKYDQSIVVTANEINEYFKVLLEAMRQIFPELAQKTKHIGHGVMRLPEGKMSSRTGNVITFDFLLDEVEKLVKEKIKDRDLPEAEKKEIPEKVAIGALKYSILKQSIGGDIVYDFEKSISFEGDSGPYLQYSHARAQSVLRKAKAERVKASLKNPPKEINQLEKDMNYFPEIVEKAGREYQPHFIALYLTELAREFNNYYAKNKIVDKNDEFSSYKVALTEAFSIIMKNGLWLLGIEAPEKM